MHGRKIPAGTIVPEVTHVKEYQIKIKIPAFFNKITLWFAMKALIVLAYVSNKRVANLSNFSTPSTSLHKNRSVGISSVELSEFVKFLVWQNSSLF